MNVRTWTSLVEVLGTFLISSVNYLTQAISGWKSFYWIKVQKDTFHHNTEGKTAGS